MSSEVYHHVRAEALARPEIFGDVRVRRGVVGAVDYLELVIACARRQLGKQHHVAEFHSGKRQTAVFRGEIASRELPVGSSGLGRHLRPEHVVAPTAIIVPGDQLGVASADEFRYRPLGVCAEHRTLLLYQTFEGVLVGRKAVHLVAGGPELLQEIVERGQHLHAGGRQRVLPGALIIEYRDLLVAVRSPLKRDVIAYGFHEFLQTPRNGLHILQAIPVLVMAEQGERAYRAVDFGSHYALRHEAAAHAHPVLLPFAHQSVDVERREQRHVALLEEIDDIVAHPAVSHVDER